MALFRDAGSRYSRAGDLVLLLLGDQQGPGEQRSVQMPWVLAAGSQGQGVWECMQHQHAGQAARVTKSSHTGGSDCCLHPEDAPCAGLAPRCGSQHSSVITRPPVGCRWHDQRPEHPLMSPQIPASLFLWKPLHQRPGTPALPAPEVCPPPVFSSSHANQGSVCRTMCPCQQLLPHLVTQASLGCRDVELEPGSTPQPPVGGAHLREPKRVQLVPWGWGGLAVLDCEARSQ